MSIIPIISLVGYALTNGISPVLQKIGAEVEKRSKLIDIAVLWRVMKNKPYLLGVALQVIGLTLGLIALRVLPLFLVQSVLAASIVVTAFFERIISHHRLNHQTVISIVVVLAGLSLMCLAAEPSRAILTNGSIKLGLELGPMILIILGLGFGILKGRLSAVLLSTISGLGFGAMAVVGRILTYPPPFWHLSINALFWSLIIYGLIAQYLFIVSLQRASGTTANALTSVTATLAPAVMGIVLFNDQIRSGYEAVLIIGAILIVFGALAIARFDNDLPENLIL